MFLEGKVAAALAFDDPPNDPTGKWVLLKTSPIDPSVPERRWMVRLTNVDESYHDDILNKDITFIEWEDAQKLPYELNLTGKLEVRANLVPVSAGRTVMNRFTIGENTAAEGLGVTTKAVEREGSNSTITYLFSLVNPELREDEQAKVEAREYITKLEAPEGQYLTWLEAATKEISPELYLEEIIHNGTNWASKLNGQDWEWRRSLLGVASSLPSQAHYTLENGTWDRVVGYWRSGQEVVHVDYASNDGYSIRFGDDEFGMIPPEKTVFQITYRLGNGRVTNVPPDAIIYFDPSLAFVESLTNPLPASGGRDPETAIRTRQLAPEAFRYLTFRAVRPEDYGEAVERLPWVQRAGAKFRWTGSWLSLFATPDPKNAVMITPAQRAALREQLDRFRQAGREAYPADPEYADLDLIITMCVEPYAYAGEVKESVMAILTGTKDIRERPGFFSADNFTFGTALERSRLEYAIQEVPGVRAVKGIKIRRRGWFDYRNFSEMAYKVAPNVVIRVENDPVHPAWGTVQLEMEGGA
jgi:hypothetical protein